MIIGYTCVYGYKKIHHILDKPRDARTGDGSNTALGESQRDQSCTWPCTKAPELDVNVEVWLQFLQWTDHPLVPVAHLGTLFLLHKVLPRGRVGKEPFYVCDTYSSHMDTQDSQVAHSPSVEDILAG